MERRLPKHVFGVDVRACANQQLHDILRLRSQCRLQSRYLAKNGESVYVGTIGEKRSDYFRFTIRGGDRESGQTEENPIGICSELEEVFNSVRLAFGNGSAELFIQIV